jgi:alpha-L-rhamnosidase
MRYVNYLTTRVDDRHLLAIGLGDWCAPYGARSPLIFTDSVISMDICRKAAFLHEVMGKKEQADFCSAVADRFRAAIRTHLIDHETMTAIGEGTPTPGCETSQAMALYYGIFDEEEIPAAHQVLLNKIHEQNDHLDTGVLGARVIFRVLSAHGDSDLAYEIMTKEDFPSYGNLVKCGFTALTESLGSGAAYENNSGIDSINHHFWGDISGWFISCICGIDLNPDATDIHHVEIAPRFVSALTHASAFHIAPDGKIEVKWERTGEDTLTLTVIVPEAMHGSIRFDKGWVCAKCGRSQAELKSGTYLLKRV